MYNKWKINLPVIALNKLLVFKHTENALFIGSIPFMLLVGRGSSSHVQLTIINALICSSLSTELINAAFRTSYYQLKGAAKSPDGKEFLVLLTSLCLCSLIIALSASTILLTAIIFFQKEANINYPAIISTSTALSTFISIRITYCQLKYFEFCILAQIALYIALVYLFLNKESVAEYDFAALFGGCTALLLFAGLKATRFHCKLSTLPREIQLLFRQLTITKNNEMMGIPGNWISGNISIVIAQFFLSANALIHVRLAQSIGGLPMSLMQLIENRIQFSAYRIVKQYPAKYNSFISAVFLRHVRFIKLIVIPMAVATLIIALILDKSPTFVGMVILYFLTAIVSLSLFPAIPLARALGKESILRDGLNIGAPAAIVSSLICIPIFGQIGVALSFGATKAFQFFFTFIQLKRKAKEMTK